jgi:hypothetical protein
VDVIVRYAVHLSAIALAVLVVVGLVAAVIAALRLWRAAKAAQREASREIALLIAGTDRLNADLAALPERQEELQERIAFLQMRIRVLQLLAKSASEALDILRSPLRYVGR